MDEWRYDESEPLGNGTFGSVFAATAPNGKSVAAKVVPRSGSASRELLVGEDLPRSPHIVPMLHVEETEDKFVIFMPRAQYSLRDRMGQPLEVSEAVMILRHIAAGLEVLNPGIVHRDLKPENVLFCDGHWAICDFGISRIAEADTATYTHKGSLTPGYAAPEQWDNKRVTPATDVYAFGVIAFELFSGNRPFGENAGMTDLRDAHVSMEPPKLEGPRRLTWLVAECLSKAPEARPGPSNILARLEKVTEEANTPASLALAEAQTRILTERAQEEIALQHARSEEERRERLFESSKVAFGIIVEELEAFVTDNAHDTSVSHRKGLDLNLRGVALNLSVPQESGSDDSSMWDVIASARIKLTTDRGSRSHSLYYADFEEPRKYAWFELGFMGFQANFQNEPKFLEPAEGLQALLPRLGTHQLAWGIKKLDPGDLTEFVEAWAVRLGKAAVGESIGVSRLPEGRTTLPRQR